MWIQVWTQSLLFHWDVNSTCNSDPKTYIQGGWARMAPSWEGRDDGEEKRWWQLIGVIPYRAVTDQTRLQGCCHLGSLTYSTSEPDTELGPHITRLLSILTFKKALSLCSEVKKTQGPHHFLLNLYNLFNFAILWFSHLYLKIIKAPVPHWAAGRIK